MGGAGWGAVCPPGPPRVFGNRERGGGGLWGRRAAGPPVVSVNREKAPAPCRKIRSRRELTRGLCDPDPTGYLGGRRTAPSRRMTVPFR